MIGRICLTSVRAAKYSPGCADDDIIDSAVDALRERGHDVDLHITGDITIDGQLLAAEQFIEWAWANIDNLALA